MQHEQEETKRAKCTPSTHKLLAYAKPKTVLAISYQATSFISEFPDLLNECPVDAVWVYVRTLIVYNLFLKTLLVVRLSLATINLF